MRDGSSIQSDRRARIQIEEQGLRMTSLEAEKEGGE